MRYLILLIVLMSACKKKNPQPSPEPDPAPVQTCKTQDTLFSGSYWYNGGNKDTIRIVFLHNNCPEEKSNTYIVYNLGTAVQPMVSPGKSFPIQNYTIAVSDNYIAASSTSHPFFNLTRGSSGQLTINCSELFNNETIFIKIK